MIKNEKYFFLCIQLNLFQWWFNSVSVAKCINYETNSVLVKQDIN